MWMKSYRTIRHYVAEDNALVKLLFCAEIKQRHAEKLPSGCVYLNVGVLAKASLHERDPATGKCRYGFRGFLGLRAIAELFSEFHLARNASHEALQNVNVELLP
jgi:hypothetical protein